MLTREYKDHPALGPRGINCPCCRCYVGPKRVAKQKVNRRFRRLGKQALLQEAFDALLDASLADLDKRNQEAEAWESNWERALAEQEWEYTMYLHETNYWEWAPLTTEEEIAIYEQSKESFPELKQITLEQHHNRKRTK